MNSEQRLHAVGNNPTVRELVGGTGFLRVATRADELPDASERYAYMLAGIRNLPGGRPGKLYCCLPSSGNPPVWTWVQVATG